jgi:hypothetical protein
MKGLLELFGIQRPNVSAGFSMASTIPAEVRDEEILGHTLARKMGCGSPPTVLTPPRVQRRAGASA